MVSAVSEEPLVRIEKIRLRRPGALILTGPSSCGKGEVARALSRVLAIPEHDHLSMGEILRTAVLRAKAEPPYAASLRATHDIGTASIFACADTTDELTRKVLSHTDSLRGYFGEGQPPGFPSQLQWLEYCTMKGLLVPNRWTQGFLEGHLSGDPGLGSRPFILDGYPRTVRAAEHLLTVLDRLHIKVTKVLHLSISKQEMISRAKARNRADDDDASLLSRYQFYVENVQPSVDYLKMALEAGSTELIDAHQPVHTIEDGQQVFRLEESISNVVASVLRSLGVPHMAVRDVLG